jgi:hypothetical protein
VIELEDTGRGASVVGWLAPLLLAAGLLAGGAKAAEPSGLPVDIRTVSVVSGLRTDRGARPLTVYRRLLPRGLTVPSRPAVGVWLSEISTGKDIDGRPQDDADHWIEGAIELRVAHRGEEGWYQLHYPVTGEFWFEAGRAVGLPKRHASASIEAHGKGWLAQATPRGTSHPSISMDWQPATVSDLAGVRRSFRAATDPFFALLAPLEGPDLERIQYLINPPYPGQTAVPGHPPAYDPATAKPDPGLVRLHLRPNLDAIQEPDLPRVFPVGTTLADLIATDQVVAGGHYYYALSLNSESSKIGSSSYPPGHRKRIPKRPPCAGNNVSLKLPAKEGTKLRWLRVYANGRRVARDAVRREGMRVRVSLAELKPGTYRIKAVAKTRDDRTLEASREVRVCKGRSSGYGGSPRGRR